VSLKRLHFAFVAVSLLSASWTASGGDSPSIRAIEARLYYQHSGSFSAPLTPAFVLRNVIIGEGDAKEPSSATLVDVLVVGRPGSVSPGVRVHFVAKSARNGKIITSRSTDVGVLSAEGVSHVGFWIYDAGCEPLIVTASLGSAPMKLKLPFLCAE
jgi:hypothetical protein